MPLEITKEEILAVYPQVAQIMADALGCDVEQVGLGVPLIEGLNAESIDFLDIIFHLERTFKVKIPRGKIVEDARGDLSEAAFEQKGHLTDAGLDAPAEVSQRGPGRPLPLAHEGGGHRAALYPETFCKVVVRALRAVPGGAPRG